VTLLPFESATYPCAPPTPTTACRPLEGGRLDEDIEVVVVLVDEDVEVEVEEAVEVEVE
jgi:hypothetical protein